MTAGPRADACAKLAHTRTQLRTTRRQFPDRRARGTPSDCGLSLFKGAAVRKRLSITCFALLPGIWLAPYVQTDFGVTPQQAADSGFAPYTADSGPRAASLTVAWKHTFSRNWTV